MKIHLKENEIIPASDIEIGDLEIIYGTEKSHIYVKNSSNELIKVANERDFEGYEEEISQKIDRGELETKQNVLTSGRGIEISGDVISSTLDVSLYKVVTDLPTENIDTNKIYLLLNTSTGETNTYKEYIYIENEGWELLGEYKAEIVLTEYLKTVDADKKYMKLSNGGATISTSSAGSLNNFGDNGQAFNAVRDCAKSVTGYKINAASFGVKADGTTAFSHKKYDTFDSQTGTYTGAKNTAVLTFSGPTGMRYAKNTGSGNDVSEDMYRYVGVIDSQDEKQKVYSAKQVDDLIKNLQDQIDELKAQING